MNAYIGSSIHTATIHQNQPAFLMAPKIVSEGKYPGPSGKQVPARKVPLNATLPTNSSVTGDRATLSSGSGHSVGIRGGIGTGVGIREETEGGGVGRVSGKGMGMGAGVLMRSFCLANSEASRAAVDVPRHHTVRAPKMPLNSYNNNDINSSNSNSNISSSSKNNKGNSSSNDSNEKRYVVNLLDSNSQQQAPFPLTRPPPSWTSTLPAPSVVSVPVPTPIPVLPVAGDAHYTAMTADKYSASSFLQLDSDEDW